MKLNELITADNHEVISTILHISKQDAILQNAVEALKKVSTFYGIKFKDRFGNDKGITESLKSEIMDLMQKLEKAQYGKF